MALLSASQLSLDYADLHIFSDVSLEVVEHAHIGIVGPNGGGKTSLLRIMVGTQAPSAGTVQRSRGLRIGYVPQVPTLTEGGTLRDVVLEAFEELHRVEAEMARSAGEMGHAPDAERRQAQARYAALVGRYESLGGYEYENLLERVTTGLALSGETLDTPVVAASGGQRTRAALARALLARPDLLVLDEPTNHLDLKGLYWLEAFLGKHPGAFVLVSHDRYFLDRVVNEVWEMERGRLQSFTGNYSKYLVQKAEQALRLQREYEAQRDYIAREEAFIRRYRAGQRAREARGRATRLARIERIEAPRENEQVALTAVVRSRTGQVVLRTKGLKVGYAESGRPVQLLSVPDVSLERGARIAVIGDNGTGKTTLLKTLLGIVPPLGGTVALGHRVSPGYYRQGQDDLPDDSTVLDALLDIRDMPLQDARSYLARFLFRGDDVFQRVAEHSGGERSRLALARLLVQEPNLLVLDEPTNHLDIPSREALEQVLSAYSGTLILVSHDRRIISRLTRQLWVVESGEVHPFDGTFDEWMRGQVEAAAAQAGARAAERAARRAPPPRAGPPKKPREDPEQAIAALEERLAEVERLLAEASARQDVAAVARLGREHGEVQAQLEAKWAEWVG